MSFKVKDLSISLSSSDGGSTCTTLTKPTGAACGVSIYWQGVARQNLTLLKAELRTAMTRA